MIGKLCFMLKKAIDKKSREYEKSLFKKIGNNSYFGKNCTFTHSTISIGDNVYVGNNCVFQSVHGNIYINDHVMFGPGVHIHGGNHVYNVVGKYMDQNEKELGSDPDVVIEDDVWVGANAIILTGVTIGRGSVIGAGSVVTKSVEPYSVVVGNPARVVKKRFTAEEESVHEKILYSK